MANKICSEQEKSLIKQCKSGHQCRELHGSFGCSYLNQDHVVFHGRTLIRLKDGTKLFGRMNHGKKDGIFRGWHTDSGAKKYELTYQNNHLMNFAYFHKNGEKEILYNSLTETIQSVKSGFEGAANIGYDNCSLVDENFPNPINLEFEIIQAANGDQLRVSVLNYQEAISLVNFIRKSNRLPLKYTINGCESRAHETAMFLENSGIITGKQFATELNTKKDGWSYHVANFVFVKIGGKATQAKTIKFKLLLDLSIQMMT